ncbi:HicA-like toxin [Gordonia phage Powerball]|uniref:HicA-like toxin n=1 Tax=Gordonia phage Powerball TaxID=2599847 RepID=A0A5J6TRL8_9CAUD|nr:HicA-like toxin [Gordonia phage Powerball]QFG13465.1 HicA-like toxin [Gordonia phage Powerball]
MTKRTDLVKTIAKAAKAAGVEWEVEREGANHTIYRLGSQRIAVGRHTELGNRYAEMVYKECEQTLGKGWWR